eukprot:g76224.t1
MNNCWRQLPGWQGLGQRPVLTAANIKVAQFVRCKGFLMRSTRSVRGERFGGGCCFLTVENIKQTFDVPSPLLGIYSGRQGMQLQCTVGRPMATTQSTLTKALAVPGATRAIDLATTRRHRCRNLTKVVILFCFFFLGLSKRDVQSAPDGRTRYEEL